MAIKTKSTAGFTLVELVIGIVVMGLALAGIMMPYFSMMQSTVEPIFEAKGAVLAQQITRRMSGVSYDEHSDHDGSLCRCGEVLELDVEGTKLQVCPGNSCTPVDKYGIDDNGFEKKGDTIEAFNDFDDFDTNSLCNNTDSLKVKNWCHKSKSINSLCENDYCLSAEFFVLSAFKDDAALKNFGAMFDSGFKDFYVQIKVSAQNFPARQTFNKTDKDITLKRADIAIIAPRGVIYKYELYRGNY